MMKKWMALLLALCLCLTGAAALAAGNATIAVNGQNGFEDSISGMLVRGDQLVLMSYNRMYVWSPETRTLEQVQGYEELTRLLYDVQESEDGTRSVTLGDTVVELDEDENLSLNSGLLAFGDRIWQVVNVFGEEGATRSMFVELTIAQDGTPGFGEVIDMDDALSIDYGGGYTGTRDLSSACEQGGLLYALSYGENGRELLVVDMENQSVDVLTLETALDIVSMASFGEGKLLLVGADYSGEKMATKLLLYDIAQEAISELGDVPCEGWNTPAGLCFDEARGLLYYTMGGSVWRCEVSESGVGEPAEFADMPLDVYSDAAAVLMDDLYIVSSYEGVVGRDVTAEKLPEKRLKIANSNYSDTLKKAYYAFADAHPEYMVTITDGVTMDGVVQDMMNRSDAVDVYSISAGSETYQALLERGFMAELGSSETIRQAVEGMYPAIRGSVMKDGEIYGLPVGVWSTRLGINSKALTEKLGFTDEEMPTDWPGLLALLEKLSDGRMENAPELSLLEPGYAASDAKMSFFFNLLQDFFLWMDADEANLERSGEVLLKLCEAFEAIDWAGFGLPEEIDWDDSSSWEYREENILFGTLFLSVGSSRYSSAYEPLLLAVEAGGEGYTGIDETVLFVNPFSKNREAAMEYVELALAQVAPTDRMNLSPENNAPVENSYYEEGLKSYDDSIAELEAALEKTEDAEKRGELTENLEAMRQGREEYERTARWDVTQEAIDSYQAVAQHFAVNSDGIWNEDSVTQVQQYVDGAITAQQLALELEKTLRMKKLEGM